MIKKKHNVDFIKIKCIEHIWDQKWCKNTNQIWHRHDKWTDEIESDNNKIKTMIMNFSNEHKWICAANNVIW